MVDRATLLKRAKEMRLNPTEPEKRLWRHLSASQLGGHKFRRQSIIDYYIADFFCPHKKLIVEVDGDTHDVDVDYKRDGQLRRKGYQTVRFANDEVITNMDGVLQALLGVLEEMPDRWNGRTEDTTPAPPPKRRGFQ